MKQKFRYLWVPPTDSYGPVGGSQCNDDTHRTLQDVKGIRERYDDFAVYDDDDIVQSWIRGMRLPCNVPRRRKNHRVSSSISAEPRPVYIFNRIHRKSGRRGIHCSFGQVKFLLTCKKKERRQKGRNTRTGYIRATQQVRKSVSLSFGLHATETRLFRPETLHFYDLKKIHCKGFLDKKQEKCRF